MMYVTTSWDDGHSLDSKLASLLERYGVQGTFYFSKKYPDIGTLLTEEEIKMISEKHEIGAHTLSHPNLATLDDESARREIAGSREWLENITGKAVNMFCYPSGKYAEQTPRLVQEAGFMGARSTYWPSIYFPSQPYEMPTTLPVYPLPFRKLAGGRLWWRKLLQPLLERYKSFRALGVPVWRMYSWGSAARAAFDYAYKNGDTFHLWGHSWELENYGMWKELEEFLAYMASKTEVQFVTNSELLNIAKDTVVMLGEGDYGSWVISPKNLDQHSVVYSFGAGVDVEWDKAMIKRFGCKVHVFDPTPRSVEWIRSQNLGEDFIFHEYGVADKDGTTVFYPPLKESNVSYSPFDLSGRGTAVELPVKRIKSIMRELGHTHIDVLKIDIEGFEYGVIKDLLASNILPAQILVEFHHRRKEIGMAKTREAVTSLQAQGYRVMDVSMGGDEYSFLKL